MSYRIEYGSNGAHRKPLKSNRRRSAVIAAFCVLTLVGGALLVKHTELPWVEKYLLPGDPAVTAAALENMADGLQSGESLSEAITAFCREIVENANGI